MPQREKVKSEISYNLRAMFSVPTFVVWAAALLLAAVMGPFGTYEDLSLVPRTLFWGLVVTASILIGYVARVVATVVAGSDRPVLFDAVAVLMMTVLLAPLVKGIGLVFEPVFVFKMAPLSDMYLYVFAVALSVFLFRRLTPGIEPTTYRFIAGEEGSFPMQMEMPSPRLTRRLSSENQSTILRISARDHHVDIATETGTQTLRMRLTDAISEMEPVEGYCSHRSHWVARSAVARVERENAQKTWLILVNGDRVPVSRKYRAELENAGIL